MNDDEMERGIAVDDKGLTVAELIERLRALPQDAAVFVEGCDCNAPAVGAFLDEDDGSVMISRYLRRAPEPPPPGPCAVCGHAAHERSCLYSIEVEGVRVRQCYCDGVVPDPRIAT